MTKFTIELEERQRLATRSVFISSELQKLKSGILGNITDDNLKGRLNEAPHPALAEAGCCSGEFCDDFRNKSL